MTIQISSRSKVLYGKVQSVLGTPETLTDGDIIRTSGLEANIYSGESSEIEYDGDDARDVPSIQKTFYNSLSFEADLAGGGESGGNIVVPPIGTYLRCCGWDEDATDPTKVVYTLSDPANIDAGTFAMMAKVSESGGNVRKYLYQMYDARGSVNLAMSPSDDRPKFVFSDLTGKYVRPVAVSDLLTMQPTGTFASAQPVNSTNTKIMRFNGVDLCVHAFGSSSMGWTVTPLDFPGCGSSINLEETQIVFDITFKQLDWDATGNPWEWQESHEQLNYFPLIIEHGTQPGHIFKLSSSNAKLQNLQRTELEGKADGLQGQIVIKGSDLTMEFALANT